MARKLRIQYPGAIYHVMNRGDRREDIFKNDFDRQCFLETLGEAYAKTQWEIHAYCLLSNHFHLVLETLRPNGTVRTMDYDAAGEATNLWEKTTAGVPIAVFKLN